MLFTDYRKMSMYHRLSRALEIRGEGYHGQTDEARLQNHSEIYGYFMELRCVIVLDQLYQNMTNNSKICNSCYDRMSDELKSSYILVPSHNLVHRNSADNQTKCTFCHELTVMVRPAYECNACIEEYPHTDKSYLDEGWGAAVPNRWIEE